MKEAENGFALVTVIVAFVLISLMAIFLTNLVSTESSVAVEKYKSNQSFYLSESGFEYVLKKKTYDIKNYTLFGGKFSIYTSTVGGKLVLKSTGFYNDFQKTISSKVSPTTTIKQGFFKKRGGIGTQQVTGVGFTPKAVIFYWTRQIASGFSADINAGMGFATGQSNQSAVSVTMLDNKNRSDQGRHYSVSNCIILLSGGGPPNLLASASFVSFDADGFTLNWTDSDTNQYLIHYIAFGGDIQAKAGNFNLTNTTGNQNITGVGFQPDFVLFNWSFWNPGDNYDTNLSRSAFGIGMAKSSTEQAAIVQAGADNTGNNLDKRWQQRTDNCILLLSTANPPAQDALASFVSMNADGFIINKSDAPANNTPIFYLAIKGGMHKVGAFNQPTTNVSQNITGIGFKGDTAMFVSWNIPANNDPLPTVENPPASQQPGVSVGFASANSQSSVWYQDRNKDPSDANMYNITGKAISLAYGQILTGQATLNSFTNDGFQLNWTNCDGTQRQILYWIYKSNLSNYSASDSMNVFDREEILIK